MRELNIAEWEREREREQERKKLKKNEMKCQYHRPIKKKHTCDAPIRQTNRRYYELWTRNVNWCKYLVVWSRSRYICLQFSNAKWRMENEWKRNQKGAFMIFWTFLYRFKQTNTPNSVEFCIYGSNCIHFFFSFFCFFFEDFTRIHVNNEDITYTRFKLYVYSIRSIVIGHQLKISNSLWCLGSRRSRNFCCKCEIFIISFRKILI